MGPEKDMAQEKRQSAGRKGHGAGEKGMALGKRGMARRHAKRGWGKHYAMILDVYCGRKTTIQHTTMPAYIKLKENVFFLYLFIFIFNLKII